MTAAIVCTAILAAMVFLLGANVGRLRRATSEAGGSQFPSDPASRLLIAIRAHGNAAEYVPTLIVLFLLAGARGPAGLTIPMIVGATVARLAHAYGMLTAASLAKPRLPQLMGAAGTYLCGVALAAAAALSLL